MTEEIRARQPVMNTSIDNLYKRERNQRTNNSDGYSFSQMLGKTVSLDFTNTNSCSFVYMVDCWIWPGISTVPSTRIRHRSSA